MQKPKIKLACVFSKNTALSASLLILVFLGITTISLGQDRKISGIVKDAVTNESIPGAYVLIKGTSAGAVTDFTGTFELTITRLDTLVISFVGYETQEIIFEGKTFFDILLYENLRQLDEIVVIGYGTQRKSDLTGSISSVKSEDLVKIPTSNAMQSLQGLVAGVQVTSASGAPGSSPVVRIRGVGTINNSSPLYVVDGVFLNDINFLSTDDISSLEVLKDASSTAIYGSRGANGVIIITTKTGIRGSGKPQLKFTGSFSLQSLEKQIDLLNGPDFARYLNDISPGTYNNIDALPNTNWQNEIFNSNAPLHNYQLSLTGGSEKVSYYISTAIFQQEGIIPKSGYSRFNIKLNNSYQVTDNLELGNNVTLSRYKQEFAPNVVAMAYRAWPINTPYTAQGGFNEVNGSGNPLAALEYSNNIASGLRGVGNVYLNYKFLNDFTFRSSYGFDLEFREAKNFNPVFSVSPTQQNPENNLFVGNTASSTWVWENTINFNKEINNHRFDLLAGYTLQKTQWEALSATVRNLIRETPDFWYIDAGERASQTASNSAAVNTLVSYLFRANYTLLDKYIFTATYRIDGSSKFGENNKYGSFPSVAAGWLVSEESFMKSIDLLSTLKLRASWGIIGNEKINVNARYPLITNGVDAVLGTPEQAQQGATLGNTSNPNLRWESTEQTDIGLEFGLLGDKLFAELDYYNRQTNDILVDLSVPAYFGNGPFVRVTTNAAQVINRGFEFNIRWRDNKNDFSYEVNLLGTSIHNEVVELGAGSGQDSFITSGSLGNGQLVTRTEIGNSIGTFYGYNVIGVFQNADELANSATTFGQAVGDLKYEDQNGDNLINSEDRIILGSSIPTFIYGINLSAKYKQFDASINIQGQKGNKIYNGKNAVRPNLQNYEATVLNRWTGEGTSNTEPKASAGGVNFEPSSYFLEDGAYLRIRSLSLGYNFPNGLLEKLKLNNARFFISGTNLITFTKYSGYTPEIGGEDVLSNGIDLGVYPVTSVYSIGITVSL